MANWSKTQNISGDLRQLVGNSAETSSVLADALVASRSAAPRDHAPLLKVLDEG